MIYELRPNEFERTRYLFSIINYHLTIESIIEGLSPARIFVDDSLSPKSAFTWFKGKAWLAGNADNDSFNDNLRILLAETYYRELADHGAGEFRLHYAPDGWQSQMEVIFKGLPRIKGLYHYYHLNANTREWDIVVPNGFTLHPVDADLLVKTDLGNLDYVVDEMQSERLSIEDFLKNSFGYCVIHEGKVVGWCMSEYNAGYCCELGIATVEGYRRQGLATLTGTAVIRQALARGIKDIGWHCLADNKASIATAKKLGFTKKLEYPGYTVSLYTHTLV